MTSHPTTISTLTRHIYTYITSLQNQPFKYKYIYIYMYKLKIFVYIYMMPFNPPPNQKKTCFKKGSFFCNSPGEYKFYSALLPPRTTNLVPPPPTWFQELFLQAPIWQVTWNRLPWMDGTKENGGWLAGCTPGN